MRNFNQICDVCEINVHSLSCIMDKAVQVFHSLELPLLLLPLLRGIKEGLRNSGSRNK